MQRGGLNIWPIFRMAVLIGCVNCALTKEREGVENLKNVAFVISEGPLVQTNRVKTLNGHLVLVNQKY